MQIAGVRDFRSRASALLKGKDLVFVTRHGKVTSLIVPLNESRAIPIELRQELIARFGEAISAQFTRAGVTEGRLARDFKIWRKGRRARRG